MSWRHQVAALAAATLTAAGSAQQYSWSISDTGDGDGIIEPGEAASLYLEVAWGPPGVAFAGSYFDVIGIEGWADGEVLSVDVWECGDILTGPPTVADNNNILDIENFQLPGLFNCGCCGDPTNPTPQLYVHWRPSGYFHRQVTIEPVHFQGDPPHTIHIYTDNFGSTIALGPIVDPLTFTVDCPADLVQDGALDSLDVTAFMNLFAARDPAADFNEDDQVDTRDAIAFLKGWAAGC